MFHGGIFRQLNKKGEAFGGNQVLQIPLQRLAFPACSSRPVEVYDTIPKTSDGVTVGDILPQTWPELILTTAW